MSRLKSEIQKENSELKDQVCKLKSNQLPAEHVLTTCPNCGASVLILRGAYNARFEDGKKFYCAVGHSFIYKK